jgi:NhaP-type Na+/H+ or K+/H+ antiporter
MQIPSLIMMIILGCIARNTFGDVMKAYPSAWTSYIRSICLAILLIRGGLQVQFKGKGLLVVFLTILPQSFESLVFSFIIYGFFNMPFSFCFALGYIISCISPSVMVPGLISLNERGYGK